MKAFILTQPHRKATVLLLTQLLTHRVIWKYAAVVDAVHVALDLALQIGHAPAPVNGVDGYHST